MNTKPQSIQIVAKQYKQRYDSNTILADNPLAGATLFTARAFEFALTL